MALVMVDIIMMAILFNFNVDMDQLLKIIQMMVLMIVSVIVPLPMVNNYLYMEEVVVVVF